MPVYEVKKFAAGLSDYEDKGPAGSFKFGTNLDIRKRVDSLSCNQALTDEGIIVAGSSASRSISPSASLSRSPSASASPSASISKSPSATASVSVSASLSPSASVSPSHSVSPSSSNSPSVSVSFALTSVFRDLILFLVPSTDGGVYGFGDTGYIYRRATDGQWSRLYKDPDGRIVGAAEWYNEGGQTWLYWATYRKLHRKPLPRLSNWNDVDTAPGVITGDSWPKTNLTVSDWHVMREIGGDLIFGNYNFLGLVGYDDSYTNEALNLIPGNVVTTLVERNGRSIIGTTKASNPTKGINAAIDSEVPLAQVGDDGELVYADMNSFIPYKRFPGGGIVNPGGVCNEVNEVTMFEWEQNALSWIDKQNIGNMSLWGVYGAEAGKNGVYSIGRRRKDHPFAMNLEYALEVDEIGAVLSINGETLISYRDGIDVGVKVVDQTTKATATYEGLDLFAPAKKPDNITEWGIVELFMKPLPSGCSVQFWYKIDKDGDFIQARTVDDNTAYTRVGGKKANFRVKANGEVFEPKVVLVPSGNTSPEVYRIRCYFL